MSLLEKLRPKEQASGLVLQVFTVYDTKVGAFMQPFVCRSQGEAMRIFGDEVNNAQGAFFRHPEDYAMFHIGSFDQGTGMVQPLATPVSLVTAVTLKRETSS